MHANKGKLLPLEKIGWQRCMSTALQCNKIRKIEGTLPPFRRLCCSQYLSVHAVSLIHVQCSYMSHTSLSGLGNEYSLARQSV